MRNYAFLLMTFISMLTTQSFSMDIPYNFPKELLYKNQPIDPLCFYEFSESKGPVTESLRFCGLDSERGRTIASYDKQLIQKRYVGFDFLWPMDKIGQPSRGYSYYKVLGKSRDSFVIRTLNNGGGSGQFTSLLLVKPDNDKITIRTLAEGDRCNGGIVKSSLIEQTLTYAINLTAYDLITLTKQNPKQLRPYDDLDDCAACCQGTATYTWDLDSNEQKLIAVDLSTAEIESSDLSHYQTCFDKLLTEYRKNGNTHLNPTEFNTLLSTFNSMCTQP